MELIIPGFLKSNHCVHSFSVVLEDLYEFKQIHLHTHHYWLIIPFDLHHESDFFGCCLVPLLAKSLLWSVFMPYTVDVATSLPAAKQDLGVGKEMQGADSPQSLFFFSLSTLSCLSV